MQSESEQNGAPRFRSPACKDLSKATRRGAAPPPAVRKGSEAVKILNLAFFAFVFSVTYRREKSFFSIFSHLLCLSGADRHYPFYDFLSSRKAAPSEFHSHGLTRTKRCSLAASEGLRVRLADPTSLVGSSNHAAGGGGGRRSLLQKEGNAGHSGKAEPFRIRQLTDGRAAGLGQISSRDSQRKAFLLETPAVE